MKNRLRYTLPALALLVSCEQLKDVAAPLGAFAGNLIMAAANNYAPGHGQAVQALLGTLIGAKPDEAGEDLASPASPEETGKLELEVALLRQSREGGRQVLEPMEDGAVLRDGQDVPEAGDRFRIAFRAGQECFVYILGVDATGWVTPIFPGAHSEHANPVEGGREYLLPDPSLAFSLNTHRGIEHVYFMASEEARPDLEAILEEFEGKTQPPPAGEERVSETAVISRGFETETRGRDIVLPAELGTRSVTPSAFLSSEAGTDLVITRWFRHE
jgi:hypothetical protein